MDQIINTLKDKVGGDLMNKLGLNKEQADGSVHAAADSVQETVQGGDLSSLTSLFSKGPNDAGANAAEGKIEQNFMSKLTGQLGLDAGKAASVKAMVMPVLMNLLQDKIGGDKGMLGSLMGGKAGDMLGGAKEKLGGLGKMFG